jgi:hypothetical protein
MSEGAAGLNYGCECRCNEITMDNDCEYIKVSSRTLKMINYARIPTKIQFIT